MEAEYANKIIKQEMTNHNEINHSIVKCIEHNSNDVMTFDDDQLTIKEQIKLAIKGEKNLIKENQFYKFMKRKSTRYKEEF